MKVVGHKPLFIISALLLLWGQITPLQAQKTTKVELLHADAIKFDKSISNGARRLVGNVKFKQDSTIMVCDSAYFYADKNMFDAFSNVQLYKVSDKSISIKSDFLQHDGDQKLARFRKNVIMRDKKVTLTTDSLDYNTLKDIGYYLYGGTIVDSASTLVSQKGHYYHRENLVFFKDKVEVNHNKGEYQIFTDTLKYNTVSKIIFIHGPTEFYNDTNYMYAEFGWYNTRTDRAQFQKKAFYSNPKQQLKADTLFYDRKAKFGQGFSNVVLTDTTQKLTVTGHYLEMHQEPQKMLVTKKAQVKQLLEGDTLYMHADTIRAQYDSTGLYRQFLAYHRVKIYKSNFQAKTDSLFFSMKDSTIQFHGSPVLWVESNQINAEFIEGFIVNQKMDRFKLHNTGFIISREDSLHFNQIKGKEIIGYFKNNQLSRIDVMKKSETIYFPVDENGLVGVNKGTSTNLTIYMRQNKVNRIVYRETPNATMYPMGELQEKELKLKDFIWLEGFQPKKPTDIFIWP